MWKLGAKCGVHLGQEFYSLVKLLLLGLMRSQWCLQGRYGDVQNNCRENLGVQSFSIVTTSIIASRNPKKFLTRLLLPWFLSTVLLTFDLTWNNKNWLFTWLKLKKLTWTQLRIYFHAIAELISEQSKVTQLTLRLPSLLKLGTKDQNYFHPIGAVSSFMHNGKQEKGHNSCRKIK